MRIFIGKYVITALTSRNSWLRDSDMLLAESPLCAVANFFLDASKFILHTTRRFLGVAKRCSKA